MDRERRRDLSEHDAPPAEGAPPRRLDRTLVWAMGGYAAVGGLVSFLGWVLDVPRLADWSGNGITIQPNSAVCAMTLGLAVLLLGAGWRRAAGVAGIVALVLGSATLAEIVSGINLDFHTQLMFGREWGRRGVIVPGRMGTPGSSSWTVLGLAVALLAFRGPGPRLASMLATLALGVGMLSLTGFLYGADTLYTLPKLTVIAVQTASFAVAVAVGLMALAPQRQPMRLLLDGGAAGFIARRAVPALLIVPVGLGLLRLMGERAGLYELAFGTAARTLVEVALLLGLLWWTLGAVRRQEAALRRSERRLSHTFESITDGFVALDAQWRYRTVNREAARMLGVPRDALLGRVAWEVFPEAAGSVAYHALRRAVAERRSVEFENFDRRLGRWFSGKAYPTEDGGVAAYFQDTTDRKVAAEEMRTRDRLLATVTDNARVGLVIVSPEHRYLYANTAYRVALGIAKTDLVGRRVADVLGAAYESQIRPRLLMAFQGARVEYELTLPAPPDSDTHEPRRFAITYQPRVESAAVSSVIVSVVDVTERARTEENLQKLVDERSEALQASVVRLHEAERLAALGNMAAGIGHDIANTTLPIRARLEMLSEGVQSQEARADVEAIGRSVAHLNSISAGLRMLALDPASEESSAPVERLTDWWADAGVMVRNALPRAVLLECDLERPEASHLPGVAMPSHRLTQVVFNLVQNAGEALATRPEGAPAGLVRIQAGVTLGADGGPRVRLSVADNGPGIAPEHRARVFEPYFSTKQRAISTGMGLSMVRRIVEAAGGSVTIEPDAGCGAGFTLLLPTPSRDDAADDRPALTAAVALADPRLNAIAMGMLRELGVEPSAGPHADGAAAPEADIWVTEPVAIGLAAAFCAAGPERCVLIVGGGPTDPENARTIGPGRLFRLEDDAPASDLRDVLVTVVRAARRAPSGEPEADRA